MKKIESKEHERMIIVSVKINFSCRVFDLATNKIIKSMPLEKFRGNLTITYAMTSGRSWMTGEKIKFDDAMLHHILHDASGTLYGVDYENKFEYFACLDNSKGENQEVEKASERSGWEDTFVNMWKMFKAGKFKEATAHWDKKNRDEFLAERCGSKRYLDYWLGLL